MGRAVPRVFQMEVITSGWNCGPGKSPFLPRSLCSHPVHHWMDLGSIWGPFRFAVWPGGPPLLCVQHHGSVHGALCSHPSAWAQMLSVQPKGAFPSNASLPPQPSRSLYTWSSQWMSVDKMAPNWITLFHRIFTSAERGEKENRSWQQLQLALQPLSQ